METFDRHPIWAASREYDASPEVDESHIQALQHWTDNPDALQSGSAFIWWTYRPAINRTIIMSETSDTAGRISPPALQEFLSIPGYNSSKLGFTNMLPRPKPLRQLAIGECVSCHDITRLTSLATYGSQ